MEKSFQYPVPKARKTRLEQAEARTEQAETRTEQAKTRIEAAETRAERAETRIESAKTRTEQAERRAEQAETLVETYVETLAGQPSVPELSATYTADEADLRALGRLTSRQREALELIAIGENTKQIAGTLNISPKTVEYHRKKLMESLDIHDVPGLVRFALRVGLIGLVPAH
jgi:DNA-binding NarL/FixJ family response regulator